MNWKDFSIDFVVEVFELFFSTFSHRRSSLNKNKNKNEMDKNYRKRCHQKPTNNGRQCVITCINVF